MRFKRSNAAVIRALVVMVSVTSLTAGVTFAGLQSQQSKLTGNVIQTATANLQISNDGNYYGDSQTGFSFANLVPGGQAMPLNGYSVYLKNAGGAPLSLKLAVSSPPSNPDGADLTKVTVLLKPVSGGPTQTFNLQALMDAATTGGLAITSPSQLNPNVVVQYTLQVAMNSDAVNGQGATINNIDLSFTGVVTAN